MDGAADVAETTYTPFQSEPGAAPVRLIVRRVKPTPGSQLALFATYSYHGFITDRDGEMLELEADHRRHAEIENAIRDLKYGVGLNHMPSGRFAANAAWLAIQVMAHNLARWTARTGLGEQVVTTKTLRRRFFSLAGRITRSARRLTLHLPQRWPWETQFSRALARLRAIPLPDLTAPSATELPTAQPNVPANSRHPGPRAVPSVSSVLILPPGPIVDRHRRPQERLQAARRPPAYPNQARIIAPVTPSHPSRCPHAVHLYESVDSGLHPVPDQAGRRAGAAHRPAGEADARFPTRPLRHPTAITASSPTGTGRCSNWRLIIAVTPRSRTPFETSSTASG